MKKLLSVLLVIAIAFSMMLSLTQMVSAEGEAWAIQVSRNGSAGGEKFDYSDYDWSTLGENLFPDPTVANFDVGGEYGRYAKLSADYEPVDINAKYWWDKPIDMQDGFVRYYKDLAEHGQLDLNSLTQDGGNYALEAGKTYPTPDKEDGVYKQNGVQYFPTARSFLNFGSGVQKTGSLTDDGSGVVRYKSAGSHRGVPLPAMEAGKYYVVKFNMKCMNAMETGAELCFEYDGTGGLGSSVSAIDLGTQFANNTVDTVCYVVYAGPDGYSDPFVRMWVSDEVFFDDFGMYEVSEDFASECAEGRALPGSAGESAPVDNSKPYAFQVSRTTGAEAIDYSEYDWDGLGENLIPDPTVDHFDAGAESNQYGRYANFDSNYNPVEKNPYYWWDKYIDPTYAFTNYYRDLVSAGTSFSQNANGYYVPEAGRAYGKPGANPLTCVAGIRTPLNWADCVTKGKFASLTDDGTGVIRFSSTGAWRTIPLPQMEANKYYVVKFNMQSADSKNGSLELCLQFDNNNSELGKNAAAITLGTGLTNAKTDTICFLVYTGANTYSDPFIKFYCQTETFFDDFGMYEIEEDYAAEQAEGVKLADPPVYVEPTAIQTTIEGENAEGAAIDYSNFDWDALGENLVPDPTVAHFDAGETGDRYGRYAKLDADFNPVDVNEYYWWDKAADTKNGFTSYYKDLVEHGKLDLSTLVQDSNGNYELEPGKVYGAADKHDGKYLVDGEQYDPVFRSPLNFSNGVTIGGSNASLTDDGSGVLCYTGAAAGSRRYFPLPAMEKNSYYVVKFDIKSNVVNRWTIDFFFWNKPVDEPDSKFNMSVFEADKVYTVTFLVHTGSETFTDPFIRVYLMGCESLFDNFGVYKVTEEYAALCSAGAKLYGKDHIPSDDWSNDENGHWKVCTDCGAVIGAPEAHTGGTATCGAKAVCEVCGAEYGEIDADNHTSDHWKCGKIATTEEDGLRYKICDACGTRFGDEVVPKIVMPVIEPGDGVPEIVVESKTAAAGSTVDVKISLKNNPGIASMKLTVEYDDGLTLKAPVAYDIYPEEADPEMPQVIQPADSGGASPIILNWISPLANIEGDVIYATLTFEVAAEAEGEQNITVTYNPNDIYNLAEENIGFAVTNGKITIGELSYIRGDINGDGEVDNKDLTRLFQYLSNWDVTVNEPALDVNGDSSVDNKDLTRLFQYLSNWDVEIY